MAASLLVLLVAGFGLFHLLTTRDFVIRVSRDEIQGRLDTAFPIHKTYLGTIEVTLSHPVLHLDSGSDRAALAVDADAGALGGLIHAGGTGELSGRVRFVPETRMLYLDGASVDRLDIGGLPAQYADIVRVAAGLAAQEYFSRHPLYQVPRPRLPWPLTNRRVRDVAVEDGSVRITLGQ